MLAALIGKNHQVCPPLQYDFIHYFDCHKKQSKLLIPAAIKFAGQARLDPNIDHDQNIHTSVGN